MKYIYLHLFVFSLLAFNNLKGQFYIQTNIGIENPYLYEFTYNASTQSNQIGSVQDFNFFRTKIATIGVIHNHTLPILNRRISLNGGLNLGFMNQFIADTITSPTGNGLIFNAKHKNVFLTPELGINFKIYKSLSFTAGLEQFVSLRKWIDSEQENIRFISEYSPDFYSTKTYYSFGLQYDLNRVNIGLKFQGSNEVSHWIKFISPRLYYHHIPQSWMINIRYRI